MASSETFVEHSMNLPCVEPNSELPVQPHTGLRVESDVVLPSIEASIEPRVESLTCVVPSMKPLIELPVKTRSEPSNKARVEPSNETLVESSTELAAGPHSESSRTHSDEHRFDSCMEVCVNNTPSTEPGVEPFVERCTEPSTEPNIQRAVERSVEFSTEPCMDPRDEPSVEPRDEHARQSDTPRRPTKCWRKCLICEAELGSLPDFRAHMLSQHMNKLPYTCMECWKKFATARDLIRHTDSNCKEVFYKCQRCDSTWSSDRHHAECQTCEQSARDRDGGVGEQRFQDASRFECNVCGSLFPLLRLLASHVKTHPKSDRPFKCHSCGQRHSTSLQLLFHARHHTPSKPSKPTAQTAASSPAKLTSTKHSTGVQHGRSPAVSSPAFSPFNGMHHVVMNGAYSGVPSVLNPAFVPFANPAFAVNPRFSMNPRFSVNSPGAPPYIPCPPGTMPPLSIKLEPEVKVRSDDEISINLSDDFPGDDGHAFVDDDGVFDEADLDTPGNSFMRDKLDVDDDDALGDASDLELELSLDSSLKDGRPQGVWNSKWKEFRCAFCPKKFRYSHQQAMHMRTHSQKQPYHCGLCDMSFHQPSGLKRHLGANHNLRGAQAKQPFKSMLSMRRKRMHRERFRALTALFAKQAGVSLANFGPEMENIGRRLMRLGAGRILTGQRERVDIKMNPTEVELCQAQLEQLKHSTYQRKRLQRSQRVQMQPARRPGRGRGRPSRPSLASSPPASERRIVASITVPPKISADSPD